MDRVIELFSSDRFNNVLDRCPTTVTKYFKAILPHCIKLFKRGQVNCAGIALHIFMTLEQQLLKEFECKMSNPIIDEIDDAEAALDKAFADEANLMGEKEFKEFLESNDLKTEVPFSMGSGRNPTVLFLLRLKLNRIDINDIESMQYTLLITLVHALKNRNDSNCCARLCEKIPLAINNLTIMSYATI